MFVRRSDAISVARPTWRGARTRRLAAWHTHTNG